MKKIILLTLTALLLCAIVIFSVVACKDKACEHTYDNSCDTTCNQCGEERTVSHDYSILEYDDHYHQAKCSVCGEVDPNGREKHTLDENYECECGVKYVLGDVGGVEGYTYVELHNSDGFVVKSISDHMGEIVEIIDFYYDENGLLIKRERFSPKYGSSETTVYEYDENDNCIKETSNDSDGNEVVITFEHDENGKVIKETGVGADGVSWTYTYEYDENGYITKEHYKDSDGYEDVYEYEFDENGNCIMESYTSLDDSYLYEREYNELGYCTKEAYTDHDGVMTVHEWVYNEEGMLVKESMSDSLGNSSVAEYHEDGYVYKVTYTYPDDTKQVRIYDENGYIVSETYYDADGNRTCVGECDLSYVDNGDGTHTHACADCDYEVTEAHIFADGECICGVKIEFTGIVVDDENSDEYRYDETTKTYTIIIPADEVGGNGYLSFDIIGTNLTLIEDTNTLLKVQHENEDGLTPAPDDLLVDVLQDNGYFGWSVLGYGDGEWEKLLYSNDGGMTWTTYTFEVKQAYTITNNTTDANGTVIGSGDTHLTYAIEGDNIALNVSPAEGYMLDTLYVTDASGSPVTVENNVFTMPASAVTVTVTFAVCDHKDSLHETATDNHDGTHSFTCTVCGVTGTEDHTIENHLCTACGAMEIVVSFDADDYEWKTGDELYFCRVSRDNQWEEYCFIATVAEDGTVTWTPDKPLYWDGTGEHRLFVSYPCTAVGWDDFMIPTDQSDVDKLKEADCMNARWIGTPTTNVIEFELKHRMAKITVNYIIASQFDLDAPVIAEVYSNAKYCIFRDADGLPIITFVGQYDAWITPYHNDNQFTVYVAPGEYNTDGMFKFYIGDAEVQIEITTPGAVTLEEGGEYTFDVKVGQDVIRIEKVSIGDIDSPFGYGWNRETDLKAIGTQAEGKTAWENGDQIIVIFTSPHFGTQYGTLTYDGNVGSWSTDVSFSYLDGETPTVSAIYAPCYEVVDGNMQLKEGMQLGMTEYISAVCSITDVTLNISFEGATRNYSRLRIVGLANQTLTVITTGFTPAGATEEATKSYTLTTDEDGNADLYGMFAKGATILVQLDGTELAQYSFYESTANGMSYALDALSAQE